MASILLSNGTVLENLIVNGDNFICGYPVTNETFDMNLSPVTITVDDYEEVHQYMKLVQITHPMESEWWFVLDDMTAEELFRLDIESKIDYLAMMADINLDDE